MAEGNIFGIAEHILVRLGEEALKEIGLIRGAKTELLKLKETVITIQAVLVDAEEQRKTNNQVKLWLQRLEDAVYDADNVVDEFRYAQLQRRLLFGNKRGKKVRVFFSRLNQLFFRTKMAHKIKNIRETLDEINKDRRDFHLEERLVEKRPLMRPETDSFVAKNEVIGRNDDKMKLVQLLLNSVEIEDNVSFIPIVGFGGLGKTTLAQFLFNDDDVQKHFELKIWVSVSVGFDVKALVGKIIKSITGTSLDQGLEMDLLQKQLREKINKKYLLVLDDIWDENEENWLRLKKYLMCGARGSKVLITTRSLRVADITHTVQPLILEGLDKDESWLLFKTVAFKEGKEVEENSDLAKIGKQIVDKCRGVPLAIKTIGRLLHLKQLRSRNPEKEWMLFKDSVLATIDGQSETDILPTLKLSYDNLPSHLKHCFAFCSLFPEDHEIDVEELIRLWIAHGFVKHSENRHTSLEDVGYEYFKDLLWMSFFQEVERTERGAIASCKMHDLMHDLAISVAGKGIIILDQSKDNARRIGSLGLGESTTNVRHVNVDFGCNKSCQIPTSLFKHKKIRSLFVSSNFTSEILGSNSIVLSNLNDAMSNLKFLRALRLTRMDGASLPDKFGELIHLRYLDLSKNRKIKVLPDSITRLYHLETLILKECDSLERLPQYTKKLVNLRHLEIAGCISLTHMPRGIGELTCLRTLTKFVVPFDNNDQLSRESAGLGELSKLNNLQGSLLIELGDGEDVAAESKHAQLKDKENLQSLDLSWREMRNFDNKEIMENNKIVLDALQPPQTLKALQVWNYMGLRISDWLSSLTNLVELELYSFGKCQYIPPLHHLSSLERLKLDEFGTIEYLSDMDGDDFFISLSSLTSTTPFLPSLKHLEIRNCENLKGWWGCKRSGNIVHHRPQPSFPNLSSLTIVRCPQLTSMPLFLNVERVELDNTSCKPLQETITTSVPSTTLSKLSDLQISMVADVESLLKVMDRVDLPSLQFLRIRECSNLASIPEEIGHLSSLLSLRIDQCPNLKSLPEGISKLSSLQSLKIRLCPNLTLLPEGISKLSALQSLIIYECPNLASLPKGIGKLTSLQSLTIYKCSNLASLPNGIGNLPSLQSVNYRKCAEFGSPDDIEAYLLNRAKR